MTTLADLIAELDRIQTLPVRERPAEKLLVFRRVEAALRMFVERDQQMTGPIQKFRPAVRELHIRLIALEKAAPAMPDVEMLREYYAALTRLRQIVSELETAVRTITKFEDLP